MSDDTSDFGFGMQVINKIIKFSQISIPGPGSLYTFKGRQNFSPNCMPTPTKIFI